MGFAQKSRNVFYSVGVGLSGLLQPAGSLAVDIALAVVGR